MHRQHVFAIAAVAVAVSLIGLIAWAAPIIPAPARVDNQSLSLAGLKELSLTVSDMSGKFNDETLTDEAIYEQWKTRLEQAGFKVVDHEDAARLLVKSQLLTDPRVPEGRSFMIFFMLEQPVRIERLKRTIVLPTYTYVTVGLEHESAVKRVFKEELQFLLDKFVAESVKAASFSN